jgi:CheY-like chemotaxis protein
VPQTLLLADDSLTIQRVIELTFAGEDIKVVAVSDGDQAIARLDTEPPDIVLADVGMPGRTGYDVAQHVKQSPALAHIPVVLLTGAFEPVDQAKAAAVGCDAVLAKPFDPQLVIGRVRELLGRPANTLATSSATTESVAAQVVDAPEAPAPVATAEPSGPRDPRVEDYFDRLDAAFATLTNSPAPPPAPPPAAANDVDWLNLYASDEAAAAVKAPDLPLEPQSFAFAALAAEPPVAVEPSRPRGSAVDVAPAPRAVPSVADAFAAILSAEQNGSGSRPEWPVLQAPAPPAPMEPVITDDVIDRVARRVIEQLSDQIVRETVANIASEMAERLVREEIERIKAAVTPSEPPANS